MKDLLKKKPSIAELSGISKSRLDCFATQLRAFLVGSTLGGHHESSAGASTRIANFSALCNDISDNSHCSYSSKFTRSRHSGGPSVKGNTLQGSLSPRSSSFKEGPPKNLSSLRIAAREKIKRRGDSHQSAAENLCNESTNNLDRVSNHSDDENPPEVTKNISFSPSFLGSLGKLPVPSSLGPGVQVPPLVSPLFSPYYCWCPPGVSTGPTSVAPPHSLGSSIGSIPLPSDASLLPNTFLPASLLTPIQPLSLSKPMDFPPFLPDPIVRMSLPASQQIPTFTPLMCDPIVHVPVIDVCSSGQGYLVSAGPALSTTIPPLHPTLVKPLIPESDSVVKGARETLRLLISGSSQPNERVMDALPAVLNNPDEKPSNIIVAGSRGLYTGTQDINVIANSIAAMGLASLSGESSGDSDSESFGNSGISKQSLEKTSDSGSAFSDDEHVPFLDPERE